MAGKRPRRGTARRHQTGLDLDAQDARHRLVDARHRNGAGLCLVQEIGVEPLPVVSGHDHVDAGIHRPRTIGYRAAGNLFDGLIITDDEAGKAHAPDQHVIDQALLHVHLGAAPARIGDHHVARAGPDRRQIRRGEQIAHRRFAIGGVARINAGVRGTVADEMFDRRQDMPDTKEIGIAGLALQTFHHRRRIRSHALRFLAVAFVRTAPAVVADHGNGRRECPILASDANFLCRDLADAAHQIGIAHRT